MKRLFSVIAALVVAATLSLSAASPAQANGAGSYGCADADYGSVAICAYDSINNYVADGFWRRDANDLPGAGYGCVDLSLHSWHNGGTVNNAMSSLVVTNGLGFLSSEAFKVRFYQYGNCSSANGYFDIWSYGTGYEREANLSSVGAAGTNWYNQVSSLQVFYYP